MNAVAEMPGNGALTAWEERLVTGNRDAEMASFGEGLLERDSRLTTFALLSMASVGMPT